MKIINIVGKHTAKALFIQGLSSKLEQPVIVNFSICDRSIETALGIENEIVYDVLDYFAGTCRLSQAIISSENGVGVMPSAIRDKYHVINEEIRDLFQKLSHYQTILVASDIAVENCDKYIFFSHPEEATDNAYWISDRELSRAECKEYFCLGILKDSNENNNDEKSCTLKEEIDGLVMNFLNERRFRKSIFGRWFR